MVFRGDPRVDPPGPEVGEERLATVDYEIMLGVTINMDPTNEAALLAFFNANPTWFLSLLKEEIFSGGSGFFLQVGKDRVGPQFFVDTRTNPRTASV